MCLEFTSKTRSINVIVSKTWLLLQSDAILDIIALVWRSENK